MEAAVVKEAVAAVTNFRSFSVNRKSRAATFRIGFMQILVQFYKNKVYNGRHRRNWPTTAIESKTDRIESSQVTQRATITTTSHTTRFLSFALPVVLLVANRAANLASARYLLELAGEAHT